MPLLAITNRGELISCLYYLKQICIPFCDSHLESSALTFTAKHFNMAAEIANISVAQYELREKWPSSPSQSPGALLESFAGWSTWQYIVTFLLAVILYDQGSQQ